MKKKVKNVNTVNLRYRQREISPNQINIIVAKCTGRNLNHVADTHTQNRNVRAQHNCHICFTSIYLYIGFLFLFLQFLQP